MPIKKFSSFEEASEDLWNFNPDENYYRLLKEYFEFWSKLSNRKFRKGIFKFSSFDEFQRKSAQNFIDEERANDER